MPETKKRKVLLRLRKQYPVRVRYYDTENTKRLIEEYNITISGMEARKQYGNNLRRARKNMKLTLREVGEMLGISAEAVRKYEQPINDKTGKREIDLEYLEIFALLYDEAPLTLLPGPGLVPMFTYRDVSPRSDLIKMELEKARYGTQKSDRLLQLFLRIIKARNNEERTYHEFFSVFVRTPLFMKRIMNATCAPIAKKYLGDEILGRTEEDMFNMVLEYCANEVENCKEQQKRAGEYPYGPEALKRMERKLSRVSVREFGGKAIFEIFGKNEDMMLTTMARIVVSSADIWDAFCNFVESSQFFSEQKYVVDMEL